MSQSLYYYWTEEFCRKKYMYLACRLKTIDIELTLLARLTNTSSNRLLKLQ